MKQHAILLSKEGSYLQSIEEFTKILIQDPSNFEALLGRVNACVHMELFHRCLKDIELLSRIEPCNVEVQVL